MSTCARIRRSVANGLIAVVTLAAMASAVLANVGGFHIARIISGSMEPTISIGDLVVVQDRPVDTLAVGQAIMLPDPTGHEAMYLHRIATLDISTGQPVVQTKGDGNPTIDAWRLAITSPTVPVLVGVIPVSLLPALPSSPWIALGLWLGLVWLVVSSFVSFFRQRKNADEEGEEPSGEEPSGEEPSGEEPSGEEPATALPGRPVETVLV